MEKRALSGSKKAKADVLLTTDMMPLRRWY